MTRSVERVVLALLGCRSGVASLIVSSFRCGAAGGCGEQPTHVLDHDPLGLQRVDRRRHVRPQARPGAEGEAGHLPDRGDVLAGEATAEHVNRLDRTPVDGGDVAEVRGVGPVVGEDSGDGLVDFGEPDSAGVEDLLSGEVESAVAGEQRPKTQTAVGALVVRLVRENSGRSVTPCRRPLVNSTPGWSPARCTPCLPPASSQPRPALAA